MNETWKPIAGFEELYEVSSHGRIKSLPRTITRGDGKPLRVKGGILLTKPNSRGYQSVSINKDRCRTWTHVHSLVAKAFLGAPAGPVGGGKHDYGVNHKDGDKLNNRADNLEYIKNSDNVLHARRTGLLDVSGSGNGRAVLNDSKVRQIRKLYESGSKQVQLAREFGINQTSISRVILRQTWGHIR